MIKPTNGLEIPDAHTYRASVLAKTYGITIEEARAVKDTGCLVGVKKSTKKTKEVPDGPTDIHDD